MYHITQPPCEICKVGKLYCVHDEKYAVRRRLFHTGSSWHEKFLHAVTVSSYSTAAILHHKRTIYPIPNVD